MDSGKSTIATTAFARSRLPRSLLTAHSAAADVGFVGVLGLLLGGNRGKRFAMAVLLFCCDLKETFGYDDLHRLTSRTVTAAVGLSGSLSMSEAYTYDKLGNLKTKTGVGIYNFAYDKNGNVTNDGKRSFMYTAFEKPYKITQGSDSTDFSYGPNRELISRIDKRGGNTTTTLMLDGIYEQVTLPTGITEHKYYVGDAVVTKRSNSTTDTFYLHKDQQGSTTAITNAAGTTVQQLMYDPWGKQFLVNNSILTYSSPAQSKGYTGHEMVNDFEVIHMGGRTYNPTLGRFMQADPFIQQPGNLQSYNRYAYVMNNPMSYTDPSGYFFSGLKNKIKKYWKVVVAAAVVYVTAGAATSWVSTWGATWGTAATAATATTAATAATLTTAGSIAVGATAGAAGGFVGGALATGSVTGALRGAASGAFAGAAFGGVNASYGDRWTMGRVTATGLAGGASSKVAGGKFADGARFAFAAAMMRYGYNKIVNYDATWKAGGDAVFKRSDTPPIEGANNIGTQGEPLDPSGWFNEGGQVSRLANHIPGVNAVAGMHDVFQVELGSIGHWARNVFNVPGMVPAAAVTYGALLTETQMAVAVSNYEWSRRRND